MASDELSERRYTANLVALTGLSVVRGLLTAPDFSECREEAVGLAAAVSKVCSDCVRDACRSDLDASLVRAEVDAISGRPIHGDLRTLRDQFVGEMRRHLRRFDGIPFGDV